MPATAEIHLSQPGLGSVAGARVLAEFGDDPRPLPRRPSPQEQLRHGRGHVVVVGKDDADGQDIAAAGEGHDVPLGDPSLWANRRFTHAQHCNA